VSGGCRARPAGKRIQCRAFGCFRRLVPGLPAACGAFGRPLRRDATPPSEGQREEARNASTTWRSRTRRSRVRDLVGCTSRCSCVASQARNGNSSTIRVSRTHTCSPGSRSTLSSRPTSRPARTFAAQRSWSRNTCEWPADHREVSSNRLHATATTAIGLIAISSLGSVHPANGRDITLALRAASRPVRANRRSAEGHAEAIV